jgi:murein L,D-transpeptidase YcbB/YkuD
MTGQQATKKSWVTRSIPLVVATFVLSGFLMFMQPTQTNAAVACNRQTFRMSSTYKTCVKHIQTMLNNLMVNGRFASLSVDGYYGSRTTDAVTNFQSWEGIGRDGSVGPVTWGRLCWPKRATTYDKYHRDRWLPAARAAGCTNV